MCIVIYNTKPFCSYEFIITDIYKSPIDSASCVAFLLRGNLDKDEKRVVSVIRQWIKEKFIIPDISNEEFKIQCALGTSDNARIYKLTPEIAANYTFNNSEWRALSDIEWMRIENDDCYIVQMENEWVLCWEGFPGKVSRILTLNKEGTEKLIKRGILTKTRQGNWKLSPKYLTFKLGLRHVNHKITDKISKNPLKLL